MNTLDEYGINQKEFYRKTLHSKLLCTDFHCDICNPIVICGFVEVNYPVNSAGDRKVWKCYCKTTNCQNVNYNIHL